jgi:hypothetical protein
MDVAIQALSCETVEFLKECGKDLSQYQEANQYFAAISGIHTFFRHQDDFLLFLECLHTDVTVCQGNTRREYGDFQTPRCLTDTICAYLSNKGVAPEILIEPTFGTGMFVLSGLQHFSTLNAVYGIEIYEPYYWETKFTILEFFLNNPGSKRPQIFLFLEDVFGYDFKGLAPSFEHYNILVIGNPPWVTNAKLSRLRSKNLPEKRNFKALTGLDALTGKSNFDISENITRKMLEAFSDCKGCITMLVKNSVIKHLLHDLPKSSHDLGDIKALRINTKQYFGVSVDASLFEARFQTSHPACTCQVSTLDAPATCRYVFGWVGDKFVSDSDLYRQVSDYDESSPYVWRQGVKHDCVKVMELHRVNGTYVNGFHEHIEIEPDLVYGCLKSSDLKHLVVSKPRKYVIIPQRYIGEDTSYLAVQYPGLYGYLQRHRQMFEQRKSTIYKGKPAFSIFGIGEYAFKPYKVAISGLYKHSTFVLVLPENDKPVMLDDTCYFIGFDEIAEAIIVWAILNGETVQTLMRSLVFTSDKRPYTKQRLMRIGIDRVVRTMKYETLLDHIRSLCGRDEGLINYVTEDDWHSFVKNLSLRGTE